MAGRIVGGVVAAAMLAATVPGPATAAPQVSPARAATAVAVKVEGNHLGRQVRVVLKGVKGQARGTKITVRTASKRKIRALPPGRYLVKPRAVKSGGWRAEAAKRKIRVKRGRTSKVTLRYVVTKAPQPAAQPAPAAQPTGGPARAWRDGWWWIDLNGDGRWDTTAKDPEGDGTITDVWSDTNADGYYDLHWWDATGDGVNDSLKLDPDYNGTLDAYLWDSDGDGQLDAGYSDSTGGQIVPLNSQEAVNGVITYGALVSLVGMHDHWRAMGYTSAPSIFP